MRASEQSSSVMLSVSFVLGFWLGESTQEAWTGINTAYRRE